MEEHTLKKCKQLLEYQNEIYIETSGGQNSNSYSSIVHFSTPLLVRHRWQLNTVVSLHSCLLFAALLLMLVDSSYIIRLPMLMSIAYEKFVFWIGVWDRIGRKERKKWNEYLVYKAWNRIWGFLKQKHKPYQLVQWKQEYKEKTHCRLIKE